MNMLIRGKLLQNCYCKNQTAVKDNMKIIKSSCCFKFFCANSPPITAAWFSAATQLWHDHQITLRADGVISIQQKAPSEDGCCASLSSSKSNKLGCRFGYEAHCEMKASSPENSKKTVDDNNSRQVTVIDSSSNINWNCLFIGIMCRDITEFVKISPVWDTWPWPWPWIGSCGPMSNFTEIGKTFFVDGLTAGNAPRARSCDTKIGQI